MGAAVDWLSIHQASFLGFAVVAGLHVLARLVPSVVLTTGRLHRAEPGGRLRGWVPRLAVLTATVAAGALAAALVLPAASGWRNERDLHDFPPASGRHHG
jgi:NhaP-type Na+/H+ or K+/H+ antiporter